MSDYCNVRTVHLAGLKCQNGGLHARNKETLPRSGRRIEFCVMGEAICTPLLQAGFIGIVGLALAEKLILVLPAYAFLIFLGATHVSGIGNFASTVIASALGSTLGTLIWYSVGRIAGKESVETWIFRCGHYVCLPLDRYRAMVALYESRQFWITLVVQTLPAIRTFSAIPAGMLRLNLLIFIPASLLGILVWNATFIGLGFGLSRHWHHPAQLAGLAVALVPLLAITVWYGLRWRRSPMRWPFQARGIT